MTITTPLGGAPPGKPSRRASFTDFEQLLGLGATASPHHTDIPDTAEAVLYLRVSTTRQMNTAIDIDEDGNSIATQREACLKRCLRLKAPISAEFIEPGNSAQSIAKRPQFKQLLHYVEEHPEVGYVVIYMRSRAFRNLTDAAITKRILANMGVKLISAKEEFGEGYMADAMEAITDIMNEVQVRQSGEDIANKMYHKAQNGGTTGRAKLGYLNVRKDFEGRLVNTIAVDHKRAPIIQWAFEQYATGEYSVVALQQALTDQGLTTRRTANHPERSLSRNQLSCILRDPYYVGMVTFKGETFPGRHEPLVSAEVFERVQRVLEARMRPNQRDIVHNHFLRGMLHCGRCNAVGRDHQLVYTQAKNRAGQYYEYYLCRGRQERQCDLPHLPVAHLAEAVFREVSILRLTDQQAELLRSEVKAHLERQLVSTREVNLRLRKELASLDLKEERLLDLVADASISSSKLGDRMNDLKVRRLAINQQLERTDDYLRQETETVLAYIDLLSRPAEFYSTATPELKRKILAAFYSRIWVDDDGYQPRAVGEQREIVKKILEACVASEPCLASESAEPGDSLEAATHTSQKTKNDPLAKVVRAICSSKSELVGDTGFEPVTSSV